MTVDLKNIAALSLPIVVLVAIAIRRVRQRAEGQKSSGTSSDDSFLASTRESVVGAYLVVLVSVGLSWSALVLLSDSTGYSSSGDMISIAPDPMIWGAPGLFLGLAFSLALHFFLNGDHPLRAPLSASDTGSIQTRSDLFWLVSAACVLAFLLTWRIQNMYAVFANDGMRFGQPLELRETQFSYSDVRSVALGVSSYGFSKRSRKLRPALVIEFSDGRRWTSHHSPVDMTKGQIEKIANVVAGRASLVVERKRVFSRKDLW